MKESAIKSVIEKLRRIMAKYPQILAAYLYGSYAKGCPGPLSDIDIAIVTSDRKIVPDLSAEIAEALQIPEEKSH